jgi:hypothetical protein
LELLFGCWAGEGWAFLPGLHLLLHGFLHLTELLFHFFAGPVNRDNKPENEVIKKPGK